MEERLRRSVWESLLEADLEQRYWHGKACQYVEIDFNGKVLLAIISSGSVAGWTLWAKVPELWQTLSAVATLLSIVLPLASLNSKVLAMTDLHGQWLQLKHQYESVWRDQDSLSEKEARTRIDAGRRKEAELSAKAITLPGNDKKLGAKSYNEVLNHWRNHA